MSKFLGPDNSYAVVPLVFAQPIVPAWRQPNRPETLNPLREMKLGLATAPLSPA